MTTLAQNLSDSATQMWVNAAVAEADRSEEYTIDTEVVRVTAYSTTVMEGLSPERTEYDTLWQIERGVGPTTVAAHTAGATLTPFPGAGGGGAVEGTVVVTPPNEVDIGAALDTSMASAPGVSNPYVTQLDAVLSNILAVGNDAADQNIVNLADPNDPQDAATKNYADTLPAETLAAVLAAGNDTGGSDIVHVPAVDVDAFASLTATATGTGGAWTRPLAQVVNGDAVAGPRAEATGTGNTDACCYARSVDGVALADNDAAATGTGEADAGGYAASVDGYAWIKGVATATGSGNADVSDLATANTGSATAGSLAVRGAASAGMSAIVDGTSARMAFNGTTPIAIPQLPASPTEQDIADVLVALGLATQAA